MSIREDCVGFEVAGHGRLFAPFFGRAQIFESPLVALKKLRRADPRAEVFLAVPVANDQVGLPVVGAFQHPHAAKAGHGIDGAGARAEQALKPLGVVRLARDVVDGDEVRLGNARRLSQPFFLAAQGATC